jgi:hypothetical protein
MYASYYGHTATVQALIGAGADPNLQDKVRAYTSSYFVLCCCTCEYGLSV